MKNPISYLFIPLLVFILFSSCKKKHFMQDESYRERVHEQFEKRKREAVNRNEALFGVFENKKLTLEQREALEFLYAYMPLCDLADYNGEFYLEQVDIALKTRDYFTWGKTIPEDIFRHFVLVHRINNEYLDNARTVFFEELKDRVKHLSMYDAALEVNHWCHEKVTYRATDGRTSAPLALVKTSWGRCGEESTFTATALRAVGIPARQCYTPRWVHTDSNHAWVEVWIDGKWHFLGACEPEPELDVAWFTGPAKRAMMVHTNVFGLYTGPEEKNLETSLYSKINLLENYAPTRIVEVKVLDEVGIPAANAEVQFKVYNYAELYPIAESTTDIDGKTSIISGLGDVFVWANKGNYFGYKKSTPNDSIIVIKLEKNLPKNKHDEIIESFIMEVPEEVAVKGIDPEKMAQNITRLAYEDSVRNAYMATFATEEYARQLALELRLNSTETWKFLQLAQGNWKEIAAFIKLEKDNPNLFLFLASLYEKDLRDTPSSFLSDHIDNNFPRGNEMPEDIYVQQVLSPRIALELIQPWRSFFQQKSIAEEIAGKEYNIENIINYIRNEIKIREEENYYNCYITPRGVYELKIADRHSRNVFFVAVCRSLGIASQIETATGKPQYYEKGKWLDAVLDEEEVGVSNLPAGIFHLKEQGNIVKPVYGTHYTFARYNNGDFKTLNLRNYVGINDYPATIKLDEGDYYMLTGSRANDGSVKVEITGFKSVENTNKDITVRLPQLEGKLFVKGIVDMNSIVNLQEGKTTLKELANGRGIMLCFLDPGKEPSKHILQDFPAVQQSIEKWNGGVLMIIPDDKISTAFNKDAFENLPAQTVWGVDNERVLLKDVTDVLQTDLQDNFPLTIYLSNNGGILYSSVGYRIGTGEDILKTIRQEQESLR